MNDQITFVSRPFTKVGANMMLSYIKENFPNLCEFGAILTHGNRRYRIVVISDRLDVLADIKEYLDNSSIL